MCVRVCEREEEETERDDDGTNLVNSNDFDSQITKEKYQQDYMPIKPSLRLI